jgi:hypothetical protein
MTNQNPYSTPASDVELQENTAVSNELSGEIKTVPFFSAFGWLGDSLKIFGAHWVIWSVMVLIFLVLLGVISSIPFIGAIIQTPLTTLLTAGFIYGAWKVSGGDDLEIGDLFVGFKQRLGALTIVGIISLVLTFIYIVVSALITLGSVVPFESILAMASGDEEAMLAGFESFDASAIPLAIITFLGLGILYSALFVFVAPLLIQHKEVNVLQAMMMSFKGTFKNLHVLIVMYIVVMFVMMVGIICLIIGIIPAIAIILIMMYKAYQAIYVD